MKNKYTFFITPEAADDVKKAQKWYRQKQVKGLSKRFTEDIKKTIRKACENPFAYAVRYDNIRVVIPDTFPYPIHFLIDEDLHRIIIMAIIFEGRNPDMAKSRLRKK